MNIAKEMEVLAATRGWANKVAFVTPEGVYSHRQIHQYARKLSTLLLSEGLKEGDRFVIALEDSPLWIALFLAVIRLGATVLVVNPYLPRSDHQAIMEDLNPRFGALQADIQSHFFGLKIFTEDELERALQQCQENHIYVEKPVNPAYVQFTSGTTGKQKAVPHTHQNFCHYAIAVGIGMLDIKQKDVLFSVSKLFFAYGFGNSLVFPLMHGTSALLLRERPTPADIGRLIDQYQVSVFFWVPSGFGALLKTRLPANTVQLRLLVSAGEPLLPSLSEKIQQAISVPLLNQLGSTEVGHAYCGTQIGDNPAESIGRALPNYQFEVRDEHGDIVTLGEKGELWVKGPTVPTCYLNSDESSARHFVDGWFKSGDCVQELPNQYFQHHGRIDDMQMVGGIKVSSLHIENILNQFPQVIESAVISEFIDNKSQLIAFLRLAIPLSDIEDALKEHARSFLAAYMVPKILIEVDAFPRTINGKLQRYKLFSKTWLNKAAEDENLPRQQHSMIRGQR